jgi:hypothetical protein
MGSSLGDAARTGRTSAYSVAPGRRCGLGGTVEAFARLRPHADERQIAYGPERSRNAKEAQGNETR